jgi:UDP-N-acetylmuramoylalanine--D-glutamate ligase
MRKRVVVLGGGESGVGAAILAVSQGWDTFVSDISEIRPEYKSILYEREIAWEDNQHTEELILNAHEVVKSPGIPNNAPIIQKVLAQGIPVLSEIELAARCACSYMIAVTGSNGKTTTSTLLYHILKQAGLDVGLAGNVGRSLAWQVAEEHHEYFVVELSSFQLDDTYEFKADIAIMLNITPDHMDRYHHNMQEYVDSKFRILQNQTEADAFIYWNDDPVIAREIEKRHPRATLYPFSNTADSSLKGYLSGDHLCINTLNGYCLMEQNKLALQGTHNLYNSMAAGIASKILDIRDEKIRAALADFTGVEHRLEKVLRIRRVDYVNDSKATNVNSCWYALQTINTRLVLILGGTDKGNDYSEIEALVRKKVRALIFLGVDNSKLHAFFDGKVEQIADAGSMEEAVKIAYRVSEQGDTVLLSPCCASFDLFENYEDRGNQFKTCVRNL